MPEYKAKLWGDSTPVVPICVFGNRSPDEALREWIFLLEDNGFHSLGAGAFAGRHAFSEKVGAGRPDIADHAEMLAFVEQLSDKLQADSPYRPLNIDHSEIGPYYIPKKADGTPARFLKARSIVDPLSCNSCGACVSCCPMGSIDAVSKETTGICIKCQACIHCCPTGARYFEDSEFLSHVDMLEQNYTRRAENTIIL